MLKTSIVASAMISCMILVLACSTTRPEAQLRIVHPKPKHSHAQQQAPVTAMQTPVPTAPPEPPPLPSVKFAKTVGIILPLSGPYENYGKRALCAIQMGFELPCVDVPKQSVWTQSVGDLTLVVGDAHGDIHVGKALVDKMVSDYKVAAIVGDILVDVSKGVAERANALSVPILALARTPHITTIGPWISRLALTPDMQASALVRYAMETGKKTHFAILYPRHAYGIDMMNAFVSAVKQQGGSVSAIVSYEDGQTTFTKEAERLSGLSARQRSQGYRTCMAGASTRKLPRNNARRGRACLADAPPQPNFDALFIPDFPKAVRTVVPALIAEDLLLSNNPATVSTYMKATGFETVVPIQLLGLSSWGEGLVSELGRDIDGALFVDSLNKTMPSPLFDQMASRFQDRMRISPTLLDVQSYDGANMMHQVLNSVSSQDLEQAKQEINTKIRSANGFIGVEGHILFGADGEMLSPIYTLMVVDGKIAVQAGQS